MDKKNKKSAVGFYAIGILWIVRALLDKLGNGSGIFATIVLSVIAYVLCTLFFPDKAVGEETPQNQEKPKKEEKKEQKAAHTGNAELDAVLEKGNAFVQKIQELNDAIPDFKLSAQIKQLEILTQKIFDAVKAHPEQLPQIKQFLNYYLPTTVKLLEQYVELQNQQLRQGNIEAGMQKIESMLDEIILAYQKQLDALFESQVVDITADIKVMEQMMAAQGLSGKE